MKQLDKEELQKRIAAYLLGSTLKEIAEDRGVTANAIRESIKHHVVMRRKGVRKKPVPDSVCEVCKTTFKGKKGTKTCSEKCYKKIMRTKSKITDEQAKDIVRLYQGKFSVKTLAERYNVSASLIYQILSGRSRADVTGKRQIRRRVYKRKTEGT